MSALKKHTNLVIVLVVVIAVAGASALLLPYVRPPVRGVVFVVNDSTAPVGVQSPDGPQTIAPGDFARLELRIRTKETAAIEVTSPNKPPLRCALGKGLHLVDATGEGTVTFQKIGYATKGFAIDGPVEPVGRECRTMVDDPKAVVYGFDEEPPAQITVLRSPPASTLVSEQRIKLRRKPR